MNKFIKKLFFSLFFVNFIFADEEIEINLPTKNALKPLYISKIFTENTKLEATYLKELHSVLDFDFNNNGFTKIVKSDYQKEFKMAHFDKEKAFDQSFWQKQKVAYVVKPEINQTTLIINVFDVENNFFKSFSDIKLCKNLSEDRKKIHKLYDNIQEIFFGLRGIASQKILFTIRKKNTVNPKLKWQSEIWLCDYDGYNAKQLTFENNYLVHPIFIPENNKDYIYVSYKSGQSKIHIRSFNNQTTTPLIQLRGNQLLPTISPNSKKIAFISDASGRPDIFLQNVDHNFLSVDKPIQLFSYPRATQASPCFSPDGEKLVFVSDKDGTPRIYLLKIPNNSYLRKRPLTHLITKKNRHNVTPAWSKDGKKLAYSAKTGKTRQIWIYDFDTNKEWQLTNGAINKENPIWAKDSLHLIYNTEDNSEAEIYLININQKKPIKIIKEKGRKRFPSFEP